jgi:hypothetical protein
MKDWKNHKILCRIFKKLREKLDHEALKIKAILDDPTMIGNEIFWEPGGGFWYVKARFDLALALHNVAFHYNIWEYWEELLMHMQEVLRLGHLFVGYDLGVRVKFPMFLLSVGRLDDAYAFCRYMVKREAESNQISLTIQKGSKEGDWIYPREKNCRFNNFLQECSEVDPTTMNIHHLFAVWLVKKKALSMYFTTMRAWVCFCSTKFGERFLDHADLSSEILGFLTDVDAFDSWHEYDLVIPQHDAELNQLADHVHNRNPYIFPLMLTTLPSAFLSNRREHDSDNETIAWHVLNNCRYSLLTLPGIKKWLIQFLERKGERHQRS